eukprot:gene5728-6625_t
MSIKFIYPTSTQNVVVIRSKKTGYIDRKFQADIPQELLPYVPIEDYNQTISYLNKVANYTIYGQLITLLVPLIAGSISFGLGQKERNNGYTPIHWYIGIILLVITALCFFFIMITLKLKYMKNLSMAVAKQDAFYTNQFGIRWTLRYVDFVNKNQTKKAKVWCELTIPTSPLAQQPLVAHPNPYPNLPPNHQHYIPMTHFHSQQQQQNVNDNNRIHVHHINISHPNNSVVPQLLHPTMDFQSIRMLSNLFDDGDDYGAFNGNDKAPYPANYNYAKRPSERRSPYGFVGLLNQGATCYLNSLIQMLYMTPELKNKLYSLDLKELGIEDLVQKHEASLLAATEKSVQDKASMVLAGLKTDSSAATTTTAMMLSPATSVSSQRNITAAAEDVVENDASQGGGGGDINLVSFLNEDTTPEAHAHQSGDPFADYDADYVASVMAFGFDEQRILMGLQKFPHVHMQERLIDWILNYDDSVPPLIDNNTTSTGESLFDNEDTYNDFAAFSWNGFEDDNKTHNRSVSPNNNYIPDASKAIIPYCSPEENLFPQAFSPTSVPDASTATTTTTTTTNNAAESSTQTTNVPSKESIAVAPPKSTRRKGRVLAYELQRLFSLLQMGDVAAISTEDLTRSFGWIGGEAGQQQDIHELNRILFDAVEHSIKLTRIENIIINLYRGVIITRIECTKCGKIIDREEFFQDVPVPVKGFNTLQDSLASFVTPEVLDGDNKYSCEACNEKVRATYGVKLGTLPPMLVLPLRRFDFDFTRGSRVKISTKFAFPTELDMTPYTSDYSLHEKNPKTVPKPAEQIYDLFSVLIHSGGAYGGHYHAYIKDVTNQGVSKPSESNNEPVQPVVTKDIEDTLTTEPESTTNGANKNKKKKKEEVEKVYSGWFDFNDSKVTPIPDSDIQKQFGNKTECAYMLVYRSRSLETTVPNGEVPIHLIEEMINFNASLEEQRVTYDKTVNSMFVYPRFVEDFEVLDGVLMLKNEEKETEHVLEVDVSTNVAGLYKMIRNDYPGNIDNTCRLVIQEFTVKDGRVILSPPLQATSSQPIKRAGVRDGSKLIVWNGASSYGVYTPPIQFRVKFYSGSSRTDYELQIDREATFTDLLALVAKTVDFPVERISVYTNTFNYLIRLEDDLPNVSLSTRLHGGMVLFVEDSAISRDQSQLRLDFEVNKHKIQVFIIDCIDVAEDSRIYSSAPAFGIHVDPKSTVAQLKEAFFDAIHPEDKLAKLNSTVIRKTQRGDYPGTKISDDSFTLKDVDICDSSRVIIENGSITTPTITVHYHFGTKNGQKAFIDHRTLSIPKKKTVLELKRELLRRVDVDESRIAEFVIKNTDVFENPISIFRDEDMTLEESGVRSEDILYLEEGVMPSKDQIVLKLHLYRCGEEYKLHPLPSSPVLHLNPQFIPPTADLFVIKPVGDLPIDKKTTIAQLKEFLFDWDLLRLSTSFDKESQDMRLWMEERLISSIEILLYVHRRKPEVQCFELPPRQLAFTGKVIADLYKFISQTYDIEEKYLKLYKKKKAEVASNNNELRGKPWLFKDGDMIAFLDTRDDPELNDKFALSMDMNNYKSSGGVSSYPARSTPRYREPEQDLKIQLDEY